MLAEVRCTVLFASMMMAIVMYNHSKKTAQMVCSFITVSDILFQLFLNEGFLFVSLFPYKYGMDDTLILFHVHSTDVSQLQQLFQHTVL